MAKDFYTMKEASERLGISEEELRNLVREGRLREFRDATGPLYRAEEVEALVGQVGPSGPTGEQEPAAPAPEQPPAEEPLGEASSVFALEPAAEADAAKTDVFTLEPAGDAAEPKSGSGSGSGISLLDDLDNITIPADPLAETVVSTGEGLEAGRSGSGLLDLAKESDDTSLGAELYDDFAAPEGQAEAAPAEPAAVEAAEYVAPVIAAEPADPMTPGFIGMAVVGVITLFVVGMSVAAAVFDAWPGVLQVLYANLWFYVGGTVLAAALFWVIGWVLGKQAAARQAAFAQTAPAPVEAEQGEE